MGIDSNDQTVRIAKAKQLGLTDEEIAVLERLELRDKKIAEVLNIAESAVKDGVANIVRKLNCSTRTQAALRAIVLGLTALPRTSQGSDPSQPAPVPRKPVPDRGNGEIALPLPEAEELEQ